MMAAVLTFSVLLFIITVAWMHLSVLDSEPCGSWEELANTIREEAEDVW